MLPSGRDSLGIGRRTVEWPYRVFESRLWADCSLTADVSARTRTVRLYSRTAEQLRRRLVQLYCGFGNFG